MKTGDSVNRLNECNHGRRIDNCVNCDLEEANQEIKRLENKILLLLSGRWDGDELSKIMSTDTAMDCMADCAYKAYIDCIRKTYELGHPCGTNHANEYALLVRAGKI